MYRRGYYALPSIKCMSMNIVERFVDSSGLTHRLVEWDYTWRIYDGPKASWSGAVRIPERSFGSEDAAREAWKELR